MKQGMFPTFNESFPKRKRRPFLPNQEMIRTSNKLRSLAGWFVDYLMFNAFRMKDNHSKQAHPLNLPSLPKTFSKRWPEEWYLKFAKITGSTNIPRCTKIGKLPIYSPGCLANQLKALAFANGGAAARARGAEGGSSKGRVFKATAIRFRHVMMNAKLLHL